MPKRIDPSNSPLGRMAAEYNKPIPEPNQRWWEDVLVPATPLSEESYDAALAPIVPPSHSPASLPQPALPVRFDDSQMSLPLDGGETHNDLPKDYWQRVGGTPVKWPYQPAHFIAESLAPHYDGLVVQLRSDMLALADKDYRLMNLCMPNAASLNKRARSIIHRMFPDLVFSYTDSHDFDVAYGLNFGYRIAHEHNAIKQTQSLFMKYDPIELASLLADSNLSQVHRNAQVRVYQKWAGVIPQLFKSFYEYLYTHEYNLLLRPLVNFKSDANTRLLHHLSRSHEFDDQFIRGYTIDPRYVNLENRLQEEMHMLYSGMQLDSTYRMWSYTHATAILQNEKMGLEYAIHPVHITPFSYQRFNGNVAIPVIRPAGAQLYQDSMIGYSIAHPDMPISENIDAALYGRLKGYGNYYVLRGFLIVTMWLQLIESLAKTGRGSIKPHHLMTPMNRTTCDVLDSHLAKWSTTSAE